MSNVKFSEQLAKEIHNFIHLQKTCLLSTLTPEGAPYASYTPYAIFENSLSIIISELAQHTANLQHFAQTSVLIIQDEQDAQEIYARTRLQYLMNVKSIHRDNQEFSQHITKLQTRHGALIQKLCQLTDFKVFELTPVHGQFIKGFAQAFKLEKGQLIGLNMQHIKP